MASKLDYLKKYLAKPPGQASSDAAGSSSKASAVKAVKDKLRSKTSRRPLEQNTLRIRDLSDTLPAARAVDDDGRRLGRRGDAGFGGSLAERPDEEVVFVDADEVEEKSRVTHETSGVAWKISQHHRGGSKKSSSGGGAAAAFRRAALADSDDDLTPARKQAGGTSGGRSQDDLETAFLPKRSAAAASSAPRRRSGIGGGGRGTTDDDDLSPPRSSGAPAAAAARGDSTAGQGGGGRADSDDDLSPPRAEPAVKKEKEEEKVKLEPCDSDDDLSPPRPGAAAAGEGRPAPRGRSKTRAVAAVRPGSEGDRQTERPPARHDSDSDLSPPRKVKTEGVKTEADSDDDLSPPRPGAAAAGKKQAGSDDDDDLSPPRPAASSGSKRQQQEAAGSDDDLSPPRQQPKAAEPKEKKDRGRASGRHDSDSDLSPPRQDGAKKGSASAQDEEGEDAPKMSSGLRAGLVKGGDLKAETAKVRAEHRAAVLAAPDDQTGRNAATVYRSKTGAKIAREEWVEQQQKKKRKKLSEYPEQELEWGGGVKQKDSREEEMAETERIAAQPFARFEPDQKYMDELKDRQDWNDPMRKFESEHDDEIAAQPAGQAKQQQAAKPKCPHAPWPNRFNILPGYRWDGAVRGNGFEKKWLETKNHRESRQAAKWKWEMEEM